MRALHGRLLILPSIIIAGMTAGCAPSWQYDFNAASRQARRQDRDLFVFYKDPMDARSGRVRDALESPAVRPLLANKVRCMLVPFYAPDRKFVSQFGIQEAPSLIVVHPDSTYHALSNELDQNTIREFLLAAKPPGRQPVLDARVSQQPKFEYFNTYERAVEKARLQHRQLIIIYKWWLDPVSTELIRRFSQPTVAAHFTESVVCILEWDHIPNRRHVAKYGVDTYPAVIAVEPNGRYRVVRGLAGVDQIIKLARRPRASRKRNPVSPTRSDHKPNQ
jgi:hypothetical protein